MKRIILLIAMLSGTFAFSQNPDPDLFQTWYLYQMEFEIDPTIVVEGWGQDINPDYPQISPSITFSEPLDFTGFGICNDFNGTLATHEGCGPNFIGGFPEILTLTNGTDSCGFDEDEFEDYYFSFFEAGFAGFCYNITTDGDGFQTLVLEGSIFSTYTFRNTAILSIQGPRFSEIQISPNPVRDILYIQSQINTETTATVYNLEGRKVLGQLTVNASLDVQSLEKGLYFLSLQTEEGTTTIKFIKE